MTDKETIQYLWTHKTQDHPWLSDEELLIDRGEGVWVWTQSINGAEIDELVGIAADSEESLEKDLA